MKRILLAAAMAVTVTAGAQPTQDARTPVLVELFTSEGCSSCPPADGLLARFERDQPIDGARIIALGQHVDYWNDLGWTDPYSTPEFTRRQYGYGRAFGLRSVYTPQMVVDGRVECVGSDAGKARDAVRRAAARPKPPLVLQVRRDATGRRASVAVEIETLPSLPEGGSAELMLALVESRRTTNVPRGENAGSTLEHVAVARWVEPIAELSGRGPWRVEPAPYELDGTPEDGRLRFVAFVQTKGQGAVLAVAEAEPGSEPKLSGEGVTSR